MTTLFNRLQDQKWFFLGLLILGWIVAINHFPAGHIILGGDVLQPINLKEQYANFHYGWFSGRVSLFFGLFYLLDVIGVTSTAQLSWYLGIFLFGAYVSFWLFARLIVPQVPRWITLVVSLFYATNVYTLYIFTATWGFTSYQILYVFIPALTGLYMKAFETRKWSFIFLFLLAVSLASASFSNPAFAVSLGIYFLLLTIALFIFRFTPLDRDAVKRLVVLIVGSFLLNAYWMLPVAPQIRGGVEELSASTDIVLSESLAKTSNAIFDTLRLLPTHEQKIYYPYNFPYPSISWLEPFLVLLTFIPFFIVLIGMIHKKSGRQKSHLLIFFTLFVVFIALVARVRYPFDTFNIILFQLPGLNALRGWDKLAIYMPFLLSALLVAVSSIAYKKKYFRGVFAGFVAVSLLLALPFYAGGIQTELSYILSGNKKKDFTTANYSALVEIPDPYYAVADIFKKNPSDNKIAMLPFSPGSSVGRVNLPKWKVNGPHPGYALYTKQYIELNGVYIPGWIFAKEFERKEYDPEWIMDLYGLLGVEYVFYHKDAKSAALERFELMRKYLEDQGAIHTLNDNEWFALYRIDTKYLFPYVYSHKNAMRLDLTAEGLPEKVSRFREDMEPLSYERKNPKEIIVSAENFASGSFVFLNEKYDPLWRAEYVSSEGDRVALARNDVVKYANAWNIEGIDSGGTIDIYYRPVRLLSLGLAISAVSLVVALSGLAYARRKNM